MRLTQISLVGLTLLLAACGNSNSDQPGAGENGEEVMAQFSSSCIGDVFVSGIVSREFSNTSWNEPFVPNDAAHVRMELTTFLFDGPSTVLAERDFAFSGLPFEYAICGDAATIESLRIGVLAVSVDIYNHEGVEPRVGDLVNEYLNTIDGPTSDLNILVTGLEHCDASNAGGFCTRNE